MLNNEKKICIRSSVISNKSHMLYGLSSWFTTGVAFYGLFNLEKPLSLLICAASLIAVYQVNKLFISTEGLSDHYRKGMVAGLTLSAVATIATPVANRLFFFTETLAPAATIPTHIPATPQKPAVLLHATRRDLQKSI